MVIEKIDLADAVTNIEAIWSPRVVSELNGQFVKVARIQGEFVWHEHADEDEFFLVLKGSVAIHLRDGVVVLGEGECCTVPRGVAHKPVAKEECHLLLFEPKSTRNTGNVVEARTVEPEDVPRL